MVAMLLYTLLAGLDYLTGLAGAFVHRELDSSITRTGLIRKSVILIVLWSLWSFMNVFVPGYIDGGFVFHFPSLEYVIISGFIIYEVISLIENLSKLGVKIPKVVINGFERMKEHNDDIDLTIKIGKREND